MTDLYFKKSHSEDNVKLSLKDSNFVLGNAQASSFPIVYCSDGFCELTGYARAQVMGKSCACKFLYGADSNETDKTKIDEALEERQELKTEIYLYQRNKNGFWCLLDIVPIKNEKSQVVLFLVSHKDITKDRTPSIVTNNNKDESGSDEEEDLFDPPTIPLRSSDMPTNYHYDRRRSRAVLYQLSGQFDKHKHTRTKSKLQKLNNFTGSISGQMPEYKVQEVKKSKFVIAHYGIFKVGWDWLILLCTFYTAIMVPYNAAFSNKDIKESRDSIYSDVVVEILFIIDIALNFCTSFLSRSGHIVYDLKQIAINYIKGWFLLDLLAALPFDFLFLFNVNLKTPVHLLKLARLLRLARLLQKIDRYSQYSAVVVTLLMCMFAMSAHWLACIWYAIGYKELKNNPQNWTVGWLFELAERIDDPIDSNRTNKPDILTSYLTALYFTCSSLTSVGFGNVSANTNAEKIFSICAMLIGAMMHAVVFGNVTAIIQRMYSRRANYHYKTKDLKDFFRTHHIPKPLKHRMQEHFQATWSVNNGIDTNEILKDFPDELRGEIGLHLHHDILSLPIFEDATQGCLRSISLHTKRAFCAPGDFLSHKGDAVNYVYLLCNGSMEVLKEEMVVAILGKGDLFGADINMDDPVGISCCDVRSLTYCELQCINIRGFVDVLSLYPDFAEKFQKDIRHDLTYNLKDGYEDEEIEGETKLHRIITLPSISEDDEESDSDGKNESPASPDSNVDGSPTSPFRKKNFRFPLPNGDIKTREKRVAFGTKRPHSSFSPKRRSSIKDRRRLNSATDSGKSNDPLSNSIDNLQIEVEGTKTNIKQLEKRITTISNELCSIGGNLKLVVQLLTPNPSLHSESPPSTPYSPYVKPSFSFGSPTSEDIGIESMDNTSLTLGVPSPGYKRHSGDRFRSPLIEKKQLLNNSLAHIFANKDIDRNPDDTTDTVNRFLKLDLRDNLQKGDCVPPISPIPRNNNCGSPTCISPCPRTSRIIMENPSPLSPILRHSKGLAECASPLSPSSRNSLTTHAFKSHDSGKQSVIVTADRAKENGYISRTTDL
ncbi:KCNH8 [Mytilus coruscus]|uniref:Voltage-gated inwardly rectifying potassium channel KCNH3 n=1 Tax=Mytilus coruscus TaxID=42192 RepID=A0A6J8E3E5_MYTCO|nr:KCNH8 [Mytilus coruscus]